MEQNRPRTRLIRNGKKYEARPVEISLPNGETKIVVKMMEVVVTPEMIEKRKENRQKAIQAGSKTKKKKNENFISLF